VNGSLCEMLDILRRKWFWCCND